jgi:hypothetical protein
MQRWSDGFCPIPYTTINVYKIVVRDLSGIIMGLTPARIDLESTAGLAWSFPRLASLGALFLV